MKTIKRSVFVLIAAAVLLFGIEPETYSSQESSGNNTATVIKPGPKYVWVAGHYKINKHGKTVWVPGHWKRV